MAGQGTQNHDFAAVSAFGHRTGQPLPVCRRTQAYPVDDLPGQRRRQPKAQLRAQLAGGGPALGDARGDADAEVGAPGHGDAGGVAGQ